MLVIRTFSSPNERSSGASDMTRPIAVQLGFVTIIPVHPRARRWPGISRR